MSYDNEQFIPSRHRNAAQTPTLAEFLLARLAEEEAAILDGWDSDGVARIASLWAGPEPGYTTVASDQGDGVWFADGREVEDARHVQILFDPARVLADVEAKRAIVELHSGDHECVDAAVVEGWGPAGWYGDESCPTLRILATIYADHPDYDESWRP